MSNVISMGRDVIEPVHSIESEQQLIGALFLRPELVERLHGVIVEEDFHEPLHSAIFAAVVGLSDAGDAVSIGLVSDALGEVQLPQGQTVRRYLADLMAGCASTDVRAHAKVIKRAAHIRSAVEAGTWLTEGLSRSSVAEDPTGVVQAAIDRLDGIVSDRQSSHLRSVAVDNALRDAIDHAQAVRNGEVAPGVSYGLSTLDYYTHGMHPGQLVVLAGRPGMGKAQPLSAQVLASDGWRKMGDIRVGDELASVDGAPSVVTGVFPQGERDVYRIALSDGRSTQCCAEHLWSVRYRDWGEDRVLPTWKIADMLTKVRYRGRLSIDLFEGDFGVDKEPPLSPWLLGFLLGDGFFSGGAVRFSSNDPENVDRVSSLLPHGLTVKKQSKYDYAISGGHNGGGANEVKDALVKLGVYGCRSYEKFIPDLYMNLKRAQRVELLRGLMDSDGWAEKHGSVRFATASERLADQVCDLVRSIGGVCSVKERLTFHTYKGERRDSRQSFMCRIRLPNPAEVFTLQRHIDRVGRSKNTVRLNIADIDLVGRHPVQCISVSHPSRLYVTDDFIVTHNTAIALHFAMMAATKGAGTAYFSLEMGPQELAQRVLAGMCYKRTAKPVTYRDIREAKNLTPGDMEKLDEAQRDLQGLPLIIEPQPAVTITQIVARARRMAKSMAAQGGALKLIVVDHIGLVRPSQRYSGSRVNEVSEITAALKSLARELDCTVLALSQLNRATENRPIADRRPTLSDLRDSGSIEQDADTVMSLFREEYYLERKPDQTDDDMIRLEQVRNTIEIEILKQRQGQTKRMTFFCDIGFNVISEMAR